MVKLLSLWCVRAMCEFRVCGGVLIDEGWVGGIGCLGLSILEF